MKKNKIILFIAIPVLTNLIFMGLYFSGIRVAQQIIAPTIEWLSFISWREFGLLEQVQNLYLLVIIVIFAIASFKRPLMLEKLFFVCGFLVMTFLLLEEIDYGIHFYNLFAGHSAIEAMNWHNQETAGKQNVEYIKRAADYAMIIWFVLVPMFARKITWFPIRDLIPSRWFFATFIVIISSSQIAHLLSGMEWDVIDGVEGNLRGNISEFREANTYYIYLLYALQLINTKIDYNRSNKEAA